MKKNSRLVETLAMIAIGFAAGGAKSKEASYDQADFRVSCQAIIEQSESIAMDLDVVSDGYRYYRTELFGEGHLFLADVHEESRRVTLSYYKYDQDDAGLLEPRLSILSAGTFTKANGVVSLSVYPDGTAESQLLATCILL